MGILDDAIREHLELKRQHGAGDEDLERLEKEAFGAPARPGDPEFADAGAVAEAETTVAPSAPPAEPEAPVESERGSTGDWLSGGGEAAESGELADVAPAAPERPFSDDAEDRPAPESVEEAPPSFEEPGPPAPEAASKSAETAEPEPPAASEPPEAPESSIFDAEEIDLGDFDLQLDDELENAAPAPAPMTEPLPPSGDAPAVPAEDDTEEPPLPVPPREAPEKGTGEEDLLGETPDFLQDAPEGEDLWFEQGPPKDFDFDDEDD
jgi:hypothetical protein